MHLVSKAFALVALFALSGCWVSERALFTPEDYAVVPMEGEYERETIRKNDAKIAKIEYLRLPGKRYRQVITYDDPAYEEQFGKPSTNSNDIAFVAIPSEHEDWYVVFEFENKPGSASPGSEQTEFMYFIAKVSEYGGMQIFQPDCRGTADSPDIVANTGPDGDKRFCVFQSKEALLAAAADAVDFIETPQVVLAEPMGSLTPKTDSDLQTLVPAEQD